VSRHNTTPAARRRPASAPTSTAARVTPWQRLRRALPTKMSHSHPRRRLLARIPTATSETAWRDAVQRYAYQARPSRPPWDPMGKPPPLHHRDPGIAAPRAVAPARAAHTQAAASSRPRDRPANRPPARCSPTMPRCMPRPRASLSVPAIVPALASRRSP